MAAAGRNDWRSRPPHLYSSSYDSYHASSGAPPEQPPPSSSYPGSYYGTPRSNSGGFPPPPHHSNHPQHSPMVSRSTESDYYYHEGPPSRSLSPTMGGPPPHHHGSHPYEPRQPAPSGTPFRGTKPTPVYRSQMIHRGTPPYSARGASVSAAGTPRSHSYPPPQRFQREPPAHYSPESPYSRSRNMGPRARMVMPLHRQQLPSIPRNMGPAPWEPPSPHSDLQKKLEREREEEEDEPEFETTPSREETEQEAPENEEEEEKGGDPLALLAKVSSDMETKPGEKSQKDAAEKQVASAPPTSPLRRTTRTSPVITPTTDNTSSGKRKAEVKVHPSFPEVPPPPRNNATAPPLKGPKAVTPMPPYYPPYGEEPPRGPPSYHYNAPPPSRNAPGYQPYPPPPHRGGPMPPSWQRGAEPEVGPHPAVVERHSFDSHDSGMSHDSTSLPPPPRRYYGQPPPNQPPSSYGPPPSHSQEWPRSPAGPPPPAMSGPPPHGQPYPPPSRYNMYGHPPPRSSDPYHGPPPYSYAQQPHMEEKTVLRRKFSWKHYPELERFLIANRDDYLEHSSKNYTAEQKQYNNWLTEQLLVVAEQNNYMFDPDDFNFVAIRDRIRCYYKSYVQTARKRGLELPGKAHIKKHRPASSLDKYAEEKNKKLREQNGEDADSATGDDDKEGASSTKSKEGENAKKASEAQQS